MSAALAVGLIAAGVAGMRLIREQPLVADQRNSPPDDKKDDPAAKKDGTPAADKPKADAKAETTAPPIVVIIEDEPSTALMLEMFLKLKGFKPVPALTGRDGLAAIAEHKPRTLILDLMLPDIDGYEICRQLRADEKTALLPIIMLSARVHHDDVKRGYAAGATRYLKKPVDLDLLASEVQRMVQLARHETPSQEVQDQDALRSASGR